MLLQAADVGESMSGEEGTYQYDELNRLASAVTTGSAPTQSLLVSGVTNRTTTSGFSYDANGNMTANPQVPTMIYDTANRLIESYPGFLTERSPTIMPTSEYTSTRVRLRRPSSTSTAGTAN